MIQKGFTIVEIIVVVVVIGILASIVIVGYNGIQNNAYDTAVRSDLEGAASQFEAYRTQQSNIDQEFPYNTTHLNTLRVRADKSSYNTSLAVNFVYCTNATRQEFALAAASKSGAIFLMTEDGFRTTSLTASNFTSTLCSTLGLTLVSSGYASSAWQTWVKS